MRMNFMRTLPLVFAFSAVQWNAQTVASDSSQISSDRKKPTSNVSAPTYPIFKFGGIFQGRYAVSATKNVDVNGLHHSDESGTDNTFLIKYMRVSMKAQISKRTQVVVLANLADFKSDPKTKVLENAFIKYQLTPDIDLQFGQFRPAFGIEELIPVDIIKSMEWSNQYNAFGKLGWTSFQIGASVGGKTRIGKLPVHYAVSVVNGNGKNQINDNDSGKLFSSRLQFDILKNNALNIGINAGAGKAYEKGVHAFAADISGKIPLSTQLSLNLIAEAKQAINHVLYNTLDAQHLGNISNYQIRAFYFLPDFRYETKNSNSRNLNAIEFSCRYEVMDENFRLDPNPHTTVMPMVSFEFLKDYGARVQLGMKMDRYRHETPDTSLYDSNLMILQIQTRF